jgi:hypothetical protein
MTDQYTKQIDRLNIGLIFLSLILAIKLPFELFLFSYAILGPLHYLTEINWLKSKTYFVRKQQWVLVLLGLSFLITLPTVLNFSAFSHWISIPWIKNVGQQLTAHIDLMILTAFLFAISIVNFQKNRSILIFLVLSIVASILILKYVPLSTIAVSIFLPTLFHIYVFTLLFMIFGTIHSKSTPGITAIALLLAIPFVVFNIDINTENYILSETTRLNFFSTNLDTLNIYIARILGADEEESLFLLSSLGIRVQIFIAFCYTYHYLNWFSKTSVIGWSKTITRPAFYFIFVLWVASVLLYWYDYKTGLTALFFLSFLHTLLEFPLNIVSIKGIYRKIRTYYTT